MHRRRLPLSGRLPLLAACLLALSVVRAQPAGPIAHWTFDEGSGGIAADSSGPYPALLQGGAGWITGRTDGAINLDGRDDYLLVPSLDIAGSGITIAAWIRVASVWDDRDQEIVSKSRGTNERYHYWTLLVRRNRLQLHLKTGAETATLTSTDAGIVPVGEWAHVAATYDGAAMRLYLNGAEVGSAPLRGTVAIDPSVPVHIGRNFYEHSYLHGALDDVRIYGRGLTSGEIAILAGDAAAADTTPPVVSSVSAHDISSGSATVSWITNEPATTRVEYGPTTSYGAAAAGAGQRTAHSVALTGLNPSTTYHYRIVSTDEAGNRSVSPDRVLTTLAAAPAAIEPVARWSMDEGSGSIAGDSAGGYIGALRNGAAWTAGKQGAAVRLDGVDDYVAVPAFDVTGSGITISAWVRVQSFDELEDQEIVSKSRGTADRHHYWMLGLKRDRLQFMLKTDTTRTLVADEAGRPPLGEWAQVAATYDGSVMRIYLNGAAAGSAPSTGAIAIDPGAPIHIGRNFYEHSHLHGTIDEVRVYDRALPPAEVAALGAGAPAATNAPPAVSLTAPANGATFTAPASMTVQANATDSDGSVAQVDFFANGTHIASDPSAPYATTWSNVPAGSYTLVAKARDDDGAVTTSSARVVTVSGTVSAPQTPRTAVFTPSLDHATAVVRYVLSIFREGDDPSRAAPAGTQDLGKPAVVDGEIAVDVSATINSLPPGSYVAVVTAVGSKGTAPSAPSPPFSR